MNQQREPMSLTDWWAVAGLAAIGLTVVACVWNLLVYTVLRRWFRVLPVYSWTAWGLMLVLLIALTPLIPRYPATCLPAYWPAVFVTVPLALALLRWETKKYIWGLATQIAAYENHLRANGIDPHGNPQRSGPVA